MNVVANPVLVELTRAGMVETRHRGAVAVVNAKGETLFSLGDIEAQTYPRSAIKAFQALPLMMHENFASTNFSPKHVALACSSHGGEKTHVEGVREMLDAIGMGVEDLNCGAHRPSHTRSSIELFSSGAKPNALHNNCSGKHSGMLASCKLLGIDHHGYIDPDHPLQIQIKQLMADVCLTDLSEVPCGCDGCSVPTWAYELKSMALGFARLFSNATGSQTMDKAGQSIADAARTHPFMIAGSKRFCTDIMTAVPRLFAKTGAEGVYCGAVADAGIGIAVKCDDGASRAAEIAFAAAAHVLPIWSEQERTALAKFIDLPQSNYNGLSTGQLRASIEFNASNV